jgi:hypothetical protein
MRERALGLLQRALSGVGLPEQSRAMAPAYIGTLFAMGGRLEEARDSFEAAIAAQPTGHPMAEGGLRQVQQMIRR